MNSPLKLVVLISGNGSNLQAIIDAIEKKKLTAKITAVISDKNNAYGLTRAKNHHIPTHVLSPKEYPSREEYNEALLTLIQSCGPDLVVLAGFMRILGSSITRAFQGKMINIHPSLLPKYPGLHTHEQVVLNGDKEHGSTVHFVDESLDGGPLIAQASIPVENPIDAATLEEHIKTLEHKLYPTVIQLIATGRLELRANVVYLDSKPQSKEGIPLSF